MGTTDYCFSFFRKPIQNIEPIRAVGIVDVYRYVIGHYAQPQTEFSAFDAIFSRIQKIQSHSFQLLYFFGIIPQTE